MIQVGIVGYGNAARVFHAPVIEAVSGLELAAIVQRRGNPPCGLRVYPDLDSMLARDPVQLIVVATPNPSHSELARKCLLAGRDVVVDKPFTTTSDEALDLIEIARRKHRLLTVHHNRRWDADFLTVRKVIASGVLGRIVMFESNYDRYRPARREGSWRERDEPGSGILFDLGSHLVDQALVLFGPPERVAGDVRRERDGAMVDDAFDLTLHYSGLRVLLRATMLAVSPRPRFRIHGTEGTFEKHGMDPQEELLKAGSIPSGENWGAEDPSQWGVLTTPAGQNRVPSERGDYRMFYQNVRDAIAEATPPAVRDVEAMEVIRILERARSENA